jgi:phosphonate transport system substrate-binding protein
MLSAAFLSAHAQEPNASPEKPAYKFGVLNIIGTGQTEEVFAPVAAEFARVLGRQVHFRTKPTYAEFREELSRETYDFAIIGSFGYVLAHDRYHYLPLARYEPPITARMVVLPDSPLRSLRDLRGKRVALPANIAGVSNLARKAFVDAGLDLKRDLTLSYMKNHDACLHLVLIRSADACASSPRGIYVFETKLGVHFRVLHETPGIPNTLLMVHRRVPKEKRDILLKTVTGWPESSEVGRAFVKNSNNMRLVPATDAEYNVVRKFPLNLGE